MKVKAKRTIAGEYGVVEHGQIVEVSEKLGKQLVYLDLAEEVSEEIEATPVKEKKEIDLSTPTVKLKGKEKRTNAGPSK
jgi:hypothetical protein